MLTWAVEVCTGPVTVRYPRGGDRGIKTSAWSTISGLVRHCCGDVLTLICYGIITNNVLEAAQMLSEQGIEVTVLRLLRAVPLPVEEIVAQMSANRHVIVVEEVCTGSGIREMLAWELRRRIPSCHVDGLDLGGDFVTHGGLDTLYHHCGLDAEAIAAFVREVLGNEDQKKT